MRPILTRSEITGSVYITTKYKMLGNGELDTHEKYDVTGEFDAIAGGIVAENDKLREGIERLVTRLRVEQCAECAKGLGAYADSLCDPLKAENDRLRDLVREMSLPYKYGECDCGLCPHTDECWDSETLEYNPDGCVILQMVRELGIEV